MLPRLATLRRDVSTLVRGLLGHTPPPLVSRSHRRAADAAPPSTATAIAAGAATLARTVVVESVRRETADAVSLTLVDPTGAPLAFRPGQFFTIEVTIDGQRLRRAYSASSDAREPGRVTITVKRVAGGRVSTFLTERAAVGDRLGLLGPSGDFTLDAAAPPAHVVAIAGGSGITPIVAIARSLVDLPATRLTLVYGNRDRASVIFADELATLAAGGRLTVDHVLDDAGGPLTEPTIAARLDALAVTDDDATVYMLCGPDPMMAAARAALTARGVPSARVREERFFAPARPTAATAAQPLTIRRGGAVTQAIVRPGDTLLDAGLAAGVPLKLSCAMGGCGACAVTLVAGSVAMDEPNCLTVGERAAGTVLACVARPTAPCTIEAPT
jgi:ring-1,2-phenylacetyl-CoA epoxidase subunit PaaE